MKISSEVTNLPSSKRRHSATNFFNSTVFCGDQGSRSQKAHYFKNARDKCFFTACISLNVSVIKILKSNFFVLKQQKNVEEGKMNLIIGPSKKNLGSII